MATINVLPQSTARQITTSQIITSVSTAIKELMENALDAKSSAIQISLMNQGLDLIEVKDDGCGIPSSDIHLVCQSSSTSKISDISDLDSLSSYGFRGEALNALCQVGDVSITTKTTDDELATKYNFSKEGFVTESQPTHSLKGTTVTIKNLFKNMPVRKQYLSNKSRASEELKKVQHVVKSLSILHFNLRVSLSHNKCMIWQKPQVTNVRLAMSQVLSLQITNNLNEMSYTSDVNDAQVHLILPKKTVKDVGVMCLSNIQQAYYIYVNKRPLRISKIEKMLSKEFNDTFQSLIPYKKYPVCLVSIELPSNSVDVNLEPNKTKVLITDVDNLIESIRKKITDYYYDPNDINQATKRKLDEDENLHSNNKARKISKDNIVREELNNDRNETTLSQLPSFLSSKEENEQNVENVPDRNEGYAKHNFGFDSNETINSDTSIQTQHDSCDVALDDLIHTSRDNSIEVNTSELNEASKQNIERRMDDISLTQWSKGNIVVNGTALQEPVKVYSNENILKEMDNSELLDMGGNSIEEQKNIRLGGFSQIESPKRNIETNKLQIDDSVICGSSIFDKSMNSSIINHSPLESQPETVKNTLTDTESSSETTCNDYFKTPGNYVSDTSNTFDNNEVLNKTDEFSRSVTSQMGCKHLNNFTKFAREIRKNIIKNEPGISFTKVAAELNNRWNVLSDDEKKAYHVNKKDQIKDKPNQNKQNSSMLEYVKKKVRKNHHTEMSTMISVNEITHRLRETLAQKHNKNVNGQNESRKENDDSSDDEDCTNIRVKEITNQNDITTMDDFLTTDIEDCMNLEERWDYFMNHCLSTTVQDGSTKTTIEDLGSENIINHVVLEKLKFKLIRNEDSGPEYYYVYKNCIGLIHMIHLYKIVIYHKKLKTYQIEMEALEDYIILSKTIVNKIMKMELKLEKVESKLESYITLRISNDEFILNGIEMLIRKCKTSNELGILVVSKPKGVSNFTSKDIVDILNLIETDNAIEVTRSLKVQKVIQNIVEEESSSAIVNFKFGYKELTNFLAYWFENIRDFNKSFIYERNVLYKLCDLPAGRNALDYLTELYP